MSLCIDNNFLRITTFLILDKAEGLFEAPDMSDIILRTGNVIIYQLQTAVLFVTVPKVTSCFCIPTKKHLILHYDFVNLSSSFFFVLFNN